MVYDSAVIVNKSMSEDTAYWIVKTMVENWDSLVESCSWLSEVTYEYMAKKEGIPLHPGAEKYYTELLK